jgi:DNA topoisomerase-1
LLDLPRVVGTDPTNGLEITAQNGKYGPYLRRGEESRSLPSEESIFTVTVDDAVAIYAQPRTRGRGAPKAPLADLGDDPASGRRVVVKDGRFGPYVTDGEPNATLGRGDDIRHLTLERGLELLAIRRAKLIAEGKPAGKAPRKAAVKKAAPKKAAKKSTKKATAKKATKKAAAKKAAAKETAAKETTIEITGDEVSSRK